MTSFRNLIARELLQAAHDLLAAEDGLSKETVAGLAEESRSVHSVPFRPRMKESIGVVGGKRVFAVDGDEVKVVHTMDFVEGGNGLVYGFIPRDEIWVDARLMSQDWPHVVFHEAVESLLMAEHGLSYEEAHARANSLELGEVRKLAKELLRMAHTVFASGAEKEVERLLKAFLRGTPWQNKVFSVGGYNI